MLSLLKNIAGCYNADLPGLRKNYGRYLDCSQNIPLAFSPFLVLVSVKMRRPKCENDGATGYVNYIDVTGVTDTNEDAGLDSADCYLHLKGGHVIPSLFSEKNTRQRLNTARLALDRFTALQNPGNAGDSLTAVLERLYKLDNSSQVIGDFIQLILKAGFRE